MRLSEMYEAADFIVARSPLLAFAEFASWAEAAALESTHSTRRAALVAVLRAAFARAEVREALFFASPALEQRLDRWLEGARGDAKLERTLAGYFTRMASRETPFGTFAGVSLGRIGDDTRIELGPRAHYRRHTRLGMGHVVRTLARSAALPELRDRLRYEPNATLHEAFGRTRFATLDLVAPPGQAQFYPTVEIEATAPVIQAIERARDGARLTDIAEALHAESAFTPSEALEFARELVDCGLLVPSWQPALTGPEPFEPLRAALAEHPELAAASARVELQVARLAELDRVPLGADRDALSALRGPADAADGTDNLSTMFYADLVKPAPSLALSRELIQRLSEAAELVQHLSPPEPNPKLEAFRQRFVERHGERWVPLVEALDADLGLGFDTTHVSARDAWIDDLVGQREPAPPPTMAPLDHVRLDLLVQTLQQGRAVCELTPERLAMFPKRAPDERVESFGVHAQLARVDGRIEIICPTLVGPSAAGMLARFCHADAALEQAVRSLVQREQERAGERVLVDVVYLPHGHFANVVLRPVLRSHELVCGGKSGAPREAQLPLSDLLVGVEEGRIVLWSQRLDREVSIRITNAHNFEADANLPIYRFLGALMVSEGGGFSGGWSWGALESSPFLPRVTSGGVVLSRARWTLWRGELRPLTAANAEGAFAATQALRRRLHLPRWVSLVEAKGPLLIDLDNCLSVELLVHAVQQAPFAILEEFLPAPAELALRGPEGAFVSEVLVPFVRARPEPETARRAVASRVASTSGGRCFAPGSEWLYVKAFTGPSSLDTVLRHVVDDVLPKFRGAGVDRWFFVPYAEPELQLRLRFHGDPAVLTGGLLLAIHEALEPMLERGDVWKVQLDTYDRELERYGSGAGMQLAEELFHVDSDATAELIALCDDRDELRWQFALLGIDRLWADLDFDLDARTRLAQSLAEAYENELAASQRLRTAIGTEYRLHAGALRQLLWEPELTEPSLRRCHSIFSRRSRRLEPIVEALREARQSGELGVDRASLAQSFAHMHAVRLLGANVRRYELVLYDFLVRQYATQRVLGARTARSARSEPPARAAARPGDV